MSLVENVTKEALELTRLFTDDIKAMMGPTGENLPNMSVEQKQILSGLLVKLMRAATGMVKEARALAKDAKTAAEQMTYEDQRNLISKFIEMMPNEEREQLRAGLGW